MTTVSTPSSLGELAQRGVSALVAALVGTLQLDEEALRPEGAGQLANGVRLAHAQPVPGAARETDEALVSLDQLPDGKSRRPQLPLPPGRSSVRVRAREQPAEVRVAAAALDQHGQVRAALQRQLAARDRAQPQRLRRMSELERAVEPVVIGQRHRLVAQLDRPGGQLLGLRGPVQEGVGRVGVELDVGRRVKAGLFHLLIVANVCSH